MKLHPVILALLITVPGTTAPSCFAANETPAKDTYVIVHGAWGAGYEWKEVGQQLRTAGCEVYRPTLTGMGERSHLSNPDIDLDTHILDVVNTILFEDLHDVILVGHSYGGMVITGITDRVTDRLRKVVYVDAFLPENGESTNAPGREPPTKDGFVMPFWNPPPSPPPHVMPQPAKTFSQPIVLKNQEAALKIPTTYILTVDPGKKPEEDTFFRFYERAQSRQGWKTIIMESDHVPQLNQPTEITKLLLEERN
jgi:pimeloyl-ACP methyl ester carboxylesterase